jgi:hypothetical protein
VCSSKDETLANEPPCLIANRLLNGTAPEACQLDATTMAWAERNLPTHCDDLEVLALKQELLAASTAGLFTGSPTGEELFKRAAGYRTKRVHYQHGLYRNPWEKDDAAVQDIAASFKRRRTNYASSLKERARLDDGCADDCCVVAKKAAKSRAKPKAKGKSKSKAVPKTTKCK